MCECAGGCTEPVWPRVLVGAAGELQVRRLGGEWSPGPGAGILEGLLEGRSLHTSITASLRVEATWIPARGPVVLAL